MLKSPKYIAGVVAILIAIAVLVSVTQAQRPTIPPLPDLDRVSAPPGATPTPRPDEQRPNDTLIPVTPIPADHIIDKTGDQVPIAEKTMYVVRKKNGEYMKIFVAPEQFEEAQGQDIHSILELSEGDEIVNSAPPLSLMQRQIPRPNGQSTEITPIHYEVVGWPASHRPEEALPYADLVVLAEITQINDARWNTPDGLKPSKWEHTAEFIPRWLIYTPFEFKIIEVLKGNAPDQAVSEFAVLGGRVGDDIVDANEPINLYSDVEIGDQMILFLGQSTSDLITVAPYTYVDALRVDHDKATADCRGSRAAEDCRVAFELSEVLAKIEASKGSKQ